MAQPSGQSDQPEESTRRGRPALGPSRPAPATATGHRPTELRRIRRTPCRARRGGTRQPAKLSKRLRHHLSLRAAVTWSIETGSRTRRRSDTEANHREPRRGAEPASGVVSARQPDDSRDHERDAYVHLLLVSVAHAARCTGRQGVGSRTKAQNARRIPASPLRWMRRGVIV
jgi:hypothetical protein